MVFWLTLNENIMLKKFLNILFLCLIVYFSLVIFYNKPNIDTNSIDLLNYYNNIVNYNLAVLVLYILFISLFGKYKFTISFITLIISALLFLYYYNSIKFKLIEGFNFFPFIS